MAHVIHQPSDKFFKQGMSDLRVAKEFFETHLKQNPKSSLPVVYPMVVYTGDKKWDAPLEIFDLFGEHKEFAKKIFNQPYHLIDVQRTSDEELQKHLWSGVVEYILKYRAKRDLKKFLKTIFQWITELEGLEGRNFLSGVLKFILHDLEEKDVLVFSEYANQYLSQDLKGEVMTLAQAFEEKGRKEGIEKGIEKEKYEVAQRLLKEGLDIRLIAKATELTVEELQNLREKLH